MSQMSEALEMLAGDTGPLTLLLNPFTSELTILGASGETLVKVGGRGPDGGGSGVVIEVDGATGQVVLRQSTGAPLLTLTGNPPSVCLKDGAGDRIELDGARGALELRDSAGREKLHFNGEIGLIEARHHADLTTLRLDARRPMLQALDTNGHSRFIVKGDEGSLTLNDGLGRPTVSADGRYGTLQLRNNLDARQPRTVALDGRYGTLQLRSPLKSGEPTTVSLDGRYGTLELSTDDSTPSRTVKMDGRYGTLGLSSGKSGGNQETVQLDGRYGTVKLKSGSHWVELDGRYGTLRLTGDVELTNADCAEDFDIAAGASLEPGTVVVLDEQGSLRACEAAYDTRVAGVISGAGAHRPGLVLDRQSGSEGRQPVALMGKVYARVDATAGPIRPGDLLTTCTRPGHAMKVLDRGLALGAILGKALAPLEKGTDLIPILVTLQ